MSGTKNVASSTHHAQCPATHSPCSAACASELHSESPHGEPGVLGSACPEWGLKNHPCGQQPPWRGLQTASSSRVFPGHHQPRKGKPGFLDLMAFVQGLKGSKVKGQGFPFRWRAQGGKPEPVSGGGAWRVVGEDMGRRRCGGVPVP